MSTPARSLPGAVLQRNLLYKQLEETLRSRILNGELVPGQRLPSDSQFCRDYMISRVTVRKALDILAGDGLIRREVGRGTFVADPLRPRQAATALSLIGFISIGDVTPFCLDILRGIEEAARHEGYFVLFTSSNYDPTLESQHVQALMARGVSGLVLLPTFDKTETLETLAASGFPAVLVDRYFAGAALDSVTSDNEMGGYQAARHLLTLGHRRIAFLGRLPISSSLDRLQGFQRALAEWGVEPDETLIASLPQPLYDETRILTSGQAQDSPAYAAVYKLLERERPTAAVCFNEYFSIATLAALRELGLSVPRDISLVGFDRDARRFVPDVPLTIVTQAPFELGATAVHMLLERIKQGPRPPRRLSVATQLLVRRSTRRLQPVKGATP